MPGDCVSRNGYEFVGGDFSNGSRPDASGDHYRLHRETIAGLPGGLPSQPGQPVCVLGSGGCRDLDLPGLAKRFRTVDLLDLDIGLTAQAVGALDETVRSRCRVIEAEVTGAITAFENYRSSPSREGLDKIASKLAQTTGEIFGRWHQNETTVSNIRIAPGSYDVVLSTCLLSQLMLYACKSVGHDEAIIATIAPLVRTSHLELLLGLVRTGGNAVLVTDVTSSDALPEIAKSGANPTQLMTEHVVNGNNHFHGMKPQLIADALKTSPTLVRNVAGSQFSRARIWNADNRDYRCSRISSLIFYYFS